MTLIAWLVFISLVFDEHDHPLTTIAAFVLAMGLSGAHA